MKKTNQSEIKQKQIIKAKRKVTRVVMPIVLIFVLALVCFIFDASNIIFSENTGELSDMRYVSGESQEEIDVSTDNMSKITHMNQITPMGKYTKVYISISPSAAHRELHIHTPYSQMHIDVNGNEVLSNLTATDEFAQEQNEIISIEPSTKETILDIIIKNEYAPNFSCSILPKGFEGIHMFNQIIAFFVFPIGVLFFFGTLLWQTKASKRKLKIEDAMSFILIISGAANIYSPYIPNVGGAISKIAMILAMAAGIIIMNSILSNFSFPVNFREGFIAIGVVLLAMAVPTYSSHFVVAIMCLITVYFLVGLVGVIYISIRQSHISIHIRDTYFYLFCVAFLPQIGFFFIKLSIEYVFLQALFPIAGGVAFCYYALTENKVNEDENEKIQQMLLAYKPIIPGRIQDVIDAFLQEPQHLRHSRNVSLYVSAICQELDLSQKQVKIVSQAAFLHDIGKMMLHKSTLFKDDKLSDEEYEEVKMHTKYGYDIFSKSDDEILKIAALVALEHHERYDGNGYYGLKDKEINNYAQIVSVADVFDATTSNRSYKKSWDFNEGINYISSHSGTLFNPKYANAFLANKDNIYKIYCNTRV